MAVERNQSGPLRRLALHDAPIQWITWTALDDTCGKDHSECYAPPLQIKPVMAVLHPQDRHQWILYCPCNISREKKYMYGTHIGGE